MLVHNFHRLSLRSSPRFRCVFDQIAPNLAVSSSSLSSVFTSANLVAASGSGSLHCAVTSTITQVAVTAVAIASGACLSTKVDFLWPKLESQPGCVIVEGVDVTGYPIFNDPKVGAMAMSSSISACSTSTITSSLSPTKGSTPFCIGSE